MYPSTFELLAGDPSPASGFGTTEDRKTSPETTTTERPWFMFVSLRDRPRCFGCGGRMLSKTVRIQANYALCELCNEIDQSEFRPFWNAIDTLGCPGELTKSRGIIFWIPPRTLPDQEAYLRWMELWEIMRARS